MASKDRNADDAEDEKANKESNPGATDDSDGGQSELGPVKPKTTGEPPDNLHRRADWFKKRHGGE